ncbi:MAG: hypothetical protein U9Q70_00030 [Chloroflexota bacterium]|nr:hypothetical protein [Chloroflexota bacterium]
MIETNYQVLAETELSEIFTTQDEDGQLLYHLELGNITIHLFPEEWEDFLELVAQVKS